MIHKINFYFWQILDCHPCATLCPTVRTGYNHLASCHFPQIPLSASNCKTGIISNNKREPTFTGPLQVWPMVYILYLFVARGHCTSVYILIQLLLTLLILVLSYRHITTLDLNHFFPVIIIPRFGRIFSKILTSWSRSSWGCGGHWTQFPVPPGVSS